MSNKWLYSEKTIDDIRKHLSTLDFKYIYSPKFIFLCGKGYDKSIENSYIETNRGIIQKYIEAKSDAIYTVLSEQLWENDFSKDIDLLTFEEFLAELSDFIILFVESYGSACELGAFTFGDKLFMEKLIIILDKKYQHDNSFIGYGPVAKAINSKTPVIYVDLNSAILSEKELRDEIEGIIRKTKEINVTNRRIINKTANEVLINSFIIEILEIIALFQPIHKEDILFLYKKIKKFDKFDFIKRDKTKFNRQIKVSYLFNILKLTNLIIEDDLERYSLSNNERKFNLMFGFSSHSINSSRNRILSRKFKYKEM